MSHGIPIYDRPIPEVADHPLFAGGPVGIMAGGNPLVHPAVQGGDDALIQHLRDQGLAYDETRGRYGVPERSFIVHGPTREQMYHLGKAFGQESVVFSQGGRHELLYTNGPNDGRFHPGLPQYGFHPTEPPPDYYTQLPGKGYLRLYFDADRLNPAPLRDAGQVQNDNAVHQQKQLLQPATRQDITAGLAKSLGEMLAKRSKNVRQQLAAVTPQQGHQRVLAFIRSRGFRPRPGTQDRFGVGRDQRELTYGYKGSPQHEMGHALMTPEGEGLREHQRQLGTVTAKPGRGMSQDDARAEELGAFAMEPSIKRRAGVSPDDSPGSKGTNQFISRGPHSFHADPSASNPETAKAYAAARAGGVAKLDAHHEGRLQVNPKGVVVPGTSIHARINARAAAARAKKGGNV